MNQSIYFIRCKKNNKYYIGRSNNPQRRFRDHMAVPINDLIREDMKRYGRKAFELIGTIFTDIPEAAAKIIEERLILECKTFMPEYGYNIRIGDKGVATVFHQMKLLKDEWLES